MHERRRCYKVDSYFFSDHYVWNNGIWIHKKRMSERTKFFVWVLGFVLAIFIGSVLSANASERKDWYDDDTGFVTGSLTDGQCLYQTFTASSTYSIASTTMRWFGDAGSAGGVTVGIYNTSAGAPSGSALVTGTLVIPDLESAGTGADYTVDLDDSLALSQGTTYAIGVKWSGSNTLTGRGNSSGTYTGGEAYSGSCASPTVRTGQDYDFETWVLDYTAPTGDPVYVTTTVTSTATYTVQNPTQDLYNGIILLILSAGILVLFLSPKRKGV